MSDFSRRVDELLLLRNLRRIDLVRATGIPESTIRAWTVRDAMPNADYALRVAQFFGVNVEYLITGKNMEEAAPLYLNDAENELIDIYRALDRKNKIVLVEVAQVLEKNFLARTAENEK